MILTLAGETSDELGRGTHRHHHDVRQIEASLHNPSLRRGGPIAINRHDRFSRRNWRNPSAAAAATTAARAFRIRIANEPESTLLQAQACARFARLLRFLR
jgi:hypothetical protein